MWYHIWIQLEVKARDKKTKEILEFNYDLEYWDQSIEEFDFNKIDKRTAVFTIKRKWYPYGGGFINSEIDSDDEYYEWTINAFWKTHGRFTYNILETYSDIFDNFYEYE